MDIPYYQDYISDNLSHYLKEESSPYKGVEGLHQIGKGGEYESRESLTFLCRLYEIVRPELKKILAQRKKDRDFIDHRVKALYQFNKLAQNDFSSPSYKTIIGLEDANGRIVIGPRQKNYYKATSDKVAELPDYLKGRHVTLFGPPDSAKLSINAMNSFHRRLPNEPAVVEELLKTNNDSPKWGADDEDSKTPTRENLISAGQNLTKCLNGTIKESGYTLEKEKLAQPFKRFPGFALPCPFLFYKQNPLPLHLYDFALHFYHNYKNEKALTFYVPKLENEEEAAYLHFMFSEAEKLIRKTDTSYKMGTIRTLVVLENPRAVFRVNEIIDELFPYFAGASLGWHDYLGSTARLFKEDGNYRIPVKADPDIVIKYIKGSHQLLADIVGPRGGIKIGGMYGMLPLTNDFENESFQITMLGFIKDVIIQMKRHLDGLWVAHPDFMRIGLALVEGWKQKESGHRNLFDQLIRSLLKEKYHKAIFDFIDGQDIQGLDYKDELYPRSLIVADLKESSFRANNDPEEIRYNVFQTLQYLTDWLCGNGCVALPALVHGESVRVMDDLATCERSRWEVWHEIYHGRFSLEDFFVIAHEEYHFIRKDLSHSKKIVQVKWNERTQKWYPIAFNLMLKLMAEEQPVEFATELLLPFTIDSIRECSDPWTKILEIDKEKYQLNYYTERFNHFFELCGLKRFAQVMGKSVLTDFDDISKLIRSFTKKEIQKAAFFHGDIGQKKTTLDPIAKAEQGKVDDSNNSIINELLNLGEEYKRKFSIKFLVSAMGKTAEEMLSILKQRLQNDEETELSHAREALYEITIKRLSQFPMDSLFDDIEALKKEYQVPALSLCVSSSQNNFQSLAMGEIIKGKKKAETTSLFEIASLSKTFACALSIEYFKSKGISLNTPVNQLLKELKSDFLLLPKDLGDKVEIIHLMNHTALNMHYVNGIPTDQEMPPIEEFLKGNAKYGYPPLEVLHIPGSKFQYSGGGFILLEYLLKAHSQRKLDELARTILKLKDFHFAPPQQEFLPYGYVDNGKEVPSGRFNFPSFAAGAFATAENVSHFMHLIGEAYHSPQGCGPISHETAVTMLKGIDKGSLAFIGAKIGKGVFIAEAGENRFALHQGANDGFRTLYLYCFAGPDFGKGFTLFCNADKKGVLFLARVAQLLLKAMRVQGIDYTKFKDNFDENNKRPEELVNLGHKELLFDSFLSSLPEKNSKHGKIDPLAKYNLLVEADILNVSNQKFARAENLLSPYLPYFDPEAFGCQGKIMDSWESARHNEEGVDVLTLQLPQQSRPQYALFSTEYHLGNQAPYVSLEGFNEQDGNWKKILKKTKLNGHSLLKIKLDDYSFLIQKVRIKIYPDGGLSRVGLYEDLPSNIISDFNGESKKFSHPIPIAQKPLYIPFNGPLLTPKGECDIASQLYGGKVVSSSNEHYGPASQINSPIPPLNMFDGLESARSRECGHFEEVLLQLGKKAKIHRIEVDLTFFLNNNPREIEIFGKNGDKWPILVCKTNIKDYAGLICIFPISYQEEIDFLKIKIYPDGGINRIRAFASC